MLKHLRITFRWREPNDLPTESSFCDLAPYHTNSVHRSSRSEDYSDGLNCSSQHTMTRMATVWGWRAYSIPCCMLLAKRGRILKKSICSSNSCQGTKQDIPLGHSKSGLGEKNSLSQKGQKSATPWTGGNGLTKSLLHSEDIPSPQFLINHRKMEMRTEDRMSVHL